MKALTLKIPPLLLVLLFGLFMWFTARQAWLYNIDSPWRLLPALVLAVAGPIFILAGVVAFQRAATTIHPMKPENTTTLVQHAIFRFSRNPMYLGFFMLLMAWGLWLGNVVGLLVGLLFIPCMNQLQIRPEEAALAKRFGAEFTEYCRHVRRWL